MEYPSELKYTENDEWIRVEGDVGTVGITDYAQDQLSDIVFLEITAATGEMLSQGEVFGEVESVKAAAEIYMPIDGVITEVNEALSDAPETINADPYGEAWMIKFEFKDSSQIEGLMDAAAYAKYNEDREH
ncbi:MAG: glycine cleavage system protein GcvH [Anaerolineales bacterium]|nr:glycine cleavage system protein GcvH [Anaerolineales bacterium]